ncbi:MAG: lysophospholipid acyltransferase family protein [Flavobacteriales bacterium]|jgi:1-acyl-sn-glycerol-3-phosphate acyltransferase
MKWIMLPLNILQAVAILAWTVFSGLLALILRLFFSPRKVVLFISHWLWSPVMLLLTGMHLRVSGREHILKDRPAIFISNHVSQLDILVLVRAITVPLFFVAKAELRKVPVLSQYMQAMGMIFVDRRDKEMAMVSMRKAIERIREGADVVTFPEGTRSKSDEPLLFKRGTFVIAREGQIPVVPVAIRGTRRMLPSGSFTLRPGKVEVIIGKPVEPEVFAHLSPEEMATCFRMRVLELLGQ